MRSRQQRQCRTRQVERRIQYRVDAAVKFLIRKLRYPGMGNIGRTVYEYIQAAEGVVGTGNNRLAVCLDRDIAGLQHRLLTAGEKL